MDEQSVRSVETAALWIAYVEHGPTNGWPVILSHGFPYDVHRSSAQALCEPRRVPRDSCRVITSDKNQFITCIALCQSSRHPPQYQAFCNSLRSLSRTPNAKSYD